jgi:hypothetical protein
MNDICSHVLSFMVFLISIWYRVVTFNLNNILDISFLHPQHHNRFLKSHTLCVYHLPPKLWASPTRYIDSISLKTKKGLHNDREKITLTQKARFRRANANPWNALTVVQQEFPKYFYNSLLLRMNSDIAVILLYVTFPAWTYYKARQ